MNSDMNYTAAQFVIAIFTGLLTAGSAQAADNGRGAVINQAGGYEQTMVFYLHPAHGFPAQPTNNTAHPAVAVSRRGVDPMHAFDGHFVGHPAIGASRGCACSDDSVIARTVRDRPSPVSAAEQAGTRPQRLAEVAGNAL